MTIFYAQNSANAAAPQNEVLAGYRRKIETLQADLVGSHLQQARALVALVAAVILLIGALSLTLAGGKLPLTVAAIPIIAIVFAFCRREKLKRMSLALANISAFYQRGIDRLEGTWHGKGETGEEFARDNHLYQWDLNIIGVGSLFELLCTTRSQAGAERLAGYLLDLAEVEEVEQRQLAVKELRYLRSLREEIALLGDYQFQDCSRALIRDWLHSEIRRPHRATQIFLLVSSLVCAILGMVGLTTLVNWSVIAPLLVPLAALQIAIAAAFSPRVRPQLKILETLPNEFIVLWQGLELLQRQQFHSPKLVALVRTVRVQNASLQVHRLERLVRRINHRKIDWVYLSSLLFATGTQLFLAVERWRAEHQEDLTVWLDCWAEFEALNALACYASEHPGSVFPKLAEGLAVFEAANLTHPLLAEGTCICNDVALNADNRFYLISGSNMAGKSTFLRAIGMNAVLAVAGAPVRATAARSSVFTVCASIAIADSLLEGKSKFLAEIERLREAICATRESRLVLFLIDEILSGTNSHDRRLAAETILASLQAGPLARSPLTTCR